MATEHGVEASFIGRGLAWPLGVDATGAIRLTRGADDLDQSIAMVLMTARGERLMRPEFGCRIWDLLFEPITPTLIGQIDRAVRDALAQWEPRIVVETVECRESVPTPGAVLIDIGYRVRATNDRRNLVHPFYVIPHDAE